MEMLKKVVIEMKEEEAKTLEKAREILMEFEEEFEGEIDLIQEEYEKFVGSPHNYALPTAVDFIAMLLEKRED